jgi:hypothetical protein
MTTARRKTRRAYAADVTAFLMWAAEPHMEDRKRLGFQAIIFLTILGDSGLAREAASLGHRRALTGSSEFSGGGVSIEAPFHVRRPAAGSPAEMMIGSNRR